MNPLDDVRAGEQQQIVIALQIVRVIGETLAPEIGFSQAVLLNHGAHGAIEHEDALAEVGQNLFGAISLRLGLGVQCSHGHVFLKNKPAGQRGCSGGCVVPIALAVFGSAPAS